MSADSVSSRITFFSRVLPVLLLLDAGTAAFAQALTPPSPQPVKTPAAKLAPKTGKTSKTTPGKAATGQTPLGIRLGTITVSPPPNAALYARAMNAFRKNDLPEAERLFRKLSQIEPGEPQDMANLGLTLAHERKADDAIAAFRTAIACTKPPHPSSETARFWEALTRLYAIKGRWADCEAAAKRAFSFGLAGKLQDPDSLNAFLGMALLTEGKTAEALPILQKKKLVPGEPETAPDIRLIFALRQTPGQLPEAIKQMQALTAAHPKDAGLQLMLADLEQQAGDIAAEGAAYTRVYQLKPDDPRAAMNAAMALTLRGDREGAIAILRDIVARFPDNARLHFQLGEMYYSEPSGKKEQFALAEKELTVAAVREPTNAIYVAQAGLSMMLQGPDRAKEASNFLRSALKLDPNLGMAQIGLGYIAEKQGDAEAAIAQYRTVIAANKDADTVAQARERLAGLLYATGKKDDAYKVFEELINQFPESDPRGTKTLSKMASLLLDDNRLSAAESAYGRLIRRTPRDPQPYLALGQTLDREKRPADARKMYELALEVDPKNDTAALILGSLYKAEKKDSEADALFEKLLAGDPQADHNQVRNELASDYEMNGRIDDALKQLGALVLHKNDPNRGANLTARSRLMIRHGRFAEAAAELTALLNENRDVDDLRYTLAEAQEKAGHPEVAVKTLTEAVVRHDATPKEGQEARIRLAELLERMGKLDDAAVKYEGVLTLDPTNIRATPGLNRVRMAEKRPEAVGDFLEAGALAGEKEPGRNWIDAVDLEYRQYNQPDRWVAFTKRVADHFPYDRPSLLRRVAALLPDGLKRPDALKEMDAILARLVVLDPNEGRSHYYLGQVREAQGRRADAIAEYKKAVQLEPRAGDVARALAKLEPPAAPQAVPASAPIPPSTTQAAKAAGS